MRNYPRNSPRAAARLVALTLLADGHLCRAELDALERIDAARRLGLTSDELQQVLGDLCADLLAGAQLNWSDACRVDPDTLVSMLDEVVEPSLRELVLQVCVEVAEADRHLADGESIVLAAAVERWGLQAELTRTGAAA